MESHVFCKIVDGRNHAAHRAEDAVVQQFFFLPLFFFPAVAVREDSGRDFGEFPLSVFHAEWGENVAIDVLLA